MRSRTGCITCRSRKLKCDESKPICGQCKKGSRECQPSEGIAFRHQQNASMNGNAGDVEDGNNKLGGFYTYRNTFDDNSVWVEIPKTIAFHNIIDPFNMEPTPEPEYLPATISTPPIVMQMQEPSQNSYFPGNFEGASGLEALSVAATSNLQYLRPLPPPEQQPSPHASNNLNFILNPTGPDRSSSVASSQIDPNLTNSHSIAPNESTAVDDHEVAFLLRHFGETPGQWMDLFDLGCYFSHHVPVDAISNPLVRHSACAYAAKQLGRVRGRKATVGGIAGRQSDIELYPNPESVNWFYIGAKYYDLAISRLMEELQHSGRKETPMTPTTGDETLSPHGRSSSAQSHRTSSGNKRRRITRAVSAYNADETLAATAILCVYEFLDNANSAWARHLSGTKSLFDLAEKEGMMPVQSPTSPGAVSQHIKPSRARKATFWNFARQDFLAAFINESQTRLNTYDLGLWRAAGLHLDDGGFVKPSNTEDSHYPERQIAMREDMISNALIWLMSKIVNFLASGDSVDHVYPQNPSSPTGLIGINQMVVLERWKGLEKELEIWHQGLPDTFKPCAVLPRMTRGGRDEPRTIFEQIWYSMPMCASTMQAYHMARILLLINRPHESTQRRSKVHSRLNSYRSIESEVRDRSQKIVAIALGRPDGAVRIHQVQALFVAGQCLLEDCERRVVLELLRDIERDLGWATDYRVRQLIKEWGWEGAG
ncbi:hypothetical protein HYALB_00009163 [Hymenoscyphus albidus]|uniref:Zn(2)-C6 fungal-type domain-containing protein n=1 Tax=Hymenoscyphus albidus TaxID=595503 RepID=A0A9N9LVZ6_9HELO|nr:hypothetical protein HYALB_00009163 [Hymenoscyphus albidus]